MPGDADVVLVGGRIFTAAPERTWAHALAVRGERLVAVGTDAQAERWSGRRTRLVGLRGRTVVPGFVDAHAHMAESAGERGWTRLDGARDLADAVDRLRRAAAATPRGGWVIGIDWDESKWPERRYLAREDLDRASTDHRVVARRVDCHMGSLNSRSLEAAADLAGTRGFEVDGSGRPTGILTEDAFAAFHARFEADEAAIERGLPSMARMAHRLGVTSIHDIVGPAEWRAYQRARRAGRLRLRVYAMPRHALLAPLIEAGLRTGFGDPWLRLGAIKIFSDGSLGAHTAALRDPYADRAGEKGMLVHAPSELHGLLERAHRAGFQTATHAIGDAAVRLVVESLEAIQDAGPRDDARHRIEHYELPDEDVLRHTKAAGVIASCQPNFVGQWSAPGGLYETRLGRARVVRNNPYRRIVRRRIPLCFGSDGMPYGPLYGVHWAVNGPFPDQRISPEEAFRAYTAGGAYAGHEGDGAGSLVPGASADFVILDGDPFRNPETIARCRVRETWLGGTRAFAATKS
ncbi:MAG TPA: amidohydrolase [Thermoplasmata archaeon]